MSGREYFETFSDKTKQRQQQQSGSLTRFRFFKDTKKKLKNFLRKFLHEKEGQNGNVNHRVKDFPESRSGRENYPVPLLGTVTSGTLGLEDLYPGLFTEVLLLLTL